MYIILSSYSRFITLRCVAFEYYVVNDCGFFERNMSHGQVRGYIIYFFFNLDLPVFTFAAEGKMNFDQMIMSKN